MRTKVVTGGAGDVFLFVDLRPRRNFWAQFETGEFLQMVDELKAYLDKMPLELWGKDEYAIAEKINYSIEKRKEAESGG